MKMKKGNNNPAYKLGEKLFMTRDRDSFFIILDKIAKEYQSVYESKKWKTDFDSHDILVHLVRGVCYVDYLINRIESGDIKTVSHLITNINFAVRCLILDKMKKNSIINSKMKTLINYKEYKMRIQDYY